MFRKTFSQPFLIHFLRHYRKTAGDPGIQHRKTTMQNFEKDMDFEDTDFDDLESDFMDVHHSHKEHKKEQQFMKERLKYQIVKQKYFNEKYPNFLTWNDKHQIKYLYRTNSEEWTIDRLSESFPALPEVIKKVVKSNFSKNESKMKNHDAAVQKNWTAFKKGEMRDLPEKLTDHLRKFSDRSSLNFISFENPDKIEMEQKPNIPTEFSDIITSYEKLINKSRNKTVDPKFKGNCKKNQLDISNDSKKEQIPTIIERNVTLQQLRNEIESGIIGGQEIPISDKMILDNSKDNESKQNIVQLKGKEINSLMEKTKYQTSSGLVKKNEKDYSHLIYPERIRIPKDKLKYGYTYKLNDCYYDSDGRFLYRVPGMG